jgi:FkbM family methyltransferase
MSDAHDSGTEVLFVVGGEWTGSPRVDNRTLYLPCSDEYESLPEKVGQFCRWALENRDFDYLFKCDDDTYVRLDRLRQVIPNDHDYVGAEWTPGVNYASGGAGYLLSRRAATIVADQLKGRPVGAEDVLVGKCLRAAGIEFHRDHRFIPFGNEVLRPQPGNDLITAHGCDQPWKAHCVEFLHQAPIVTCRPCGGLGNRMFQVAAALGYAAKYQTHRTVFPDDLPASWRGTVFRKLHYGSIRTELLTVSDPADFSYQSIPHHPSCSVAISGYMQSERYFDHCHDLVRETFSFPEEVRAMLTDRFGADLAQQPVSIHIRRGDFLQKQQYHHVQTKEYYLRALDLLDQYIEVRRILCFSDDPEWCQANFGQDSRVRVVEGQPDFCDMALMSLCSHHVIANSSFSWWGAWLNPSPDKIVIAPKNYLGPAFSNLTDRDLIPGDWIRLDCDSNPVGSQIHRHGYWVVGSTKHHAHDEVLCQRLVEFFSREGKSVVDFGCGTGSYLRALRNAGMDCDGYDGNPRTQQMSGGLGRVLDLSQCIELPRTYDWVLSLEVGEHIPREFEQSFINNLHRYNTKGIVLSWAVPGQGGFGHVNERENQQIAVKFSSLGYYRDVLAERCLRESVTNCSWFRQTMMVFRRDVLQQSTPLSKLQIRRLLGRDDPVILELGCNDGMDSIEFLNEFKDIELHCFEADPRPIQRFRQRIQDPRCTLHELAISDCDGETILYLSGGDPFGVGADWDLSSSIRKPTGHLEVFPWCTFERSGRVPTRSLDSWLLEHPSISTIDFIWADLQGTEVDLLQGGQIALRDRTRFLYTKYYDRPMYEGQIDGEEILKRLPEFELVGVFEGYYMLLRNTRVDDFH